MKELGPAARALLADYAAARPGDCSRARNWEGVQRRVAARRPRTSLRRQIAWGCVAALAAALLLLVLDRVLPQPSLQVVDAPPAGSQAVHGDASEAAMQPTVEAERSQPTTDPQPVVEPIAEPEPAPSVRPAKERPAARPRAEAVTAESLGLETQLVARAREALGRGDLEAAQSALDEHARRFPRGALEEDRIAYATIVACRRGDVDATAQRRSFSRRYPRSPHRPRVDEACS